MVRKSEMTEMIIDINAVRDPLLSQLASALYERFPQLISLAFFGSRVAGEPDEHSDYDVLLILPEGLAWKERGKAELDLERQFGVRLQLVVTSPRGVEFYTRLEPSFRFWLKEAVILGKAEILNGDLPPVARQGCLGSLLEAELDLEEAQEETTLDERGRNYYRILRKILIVKGVIEGDYSYAWLREELRKLLGERWIALLRQPGAHFSREEVETIADIVRDKLAEVKAKAEVMSPNESDEFLNRLKG